MALHRRRLLALLAAGGGTVAGCRDIASRPGSPTDGTPTDATPRPKPASEVGCPGYDRREPERVVCSQDPPEDSLVLEPDPETVELPTATVDCRLTNTLDRPLATNYFDWTLHRYRDDAWHYLGPYVVPMPLHKLPPGETHVRRLVVDNTDLERVRPPSPETATGTGDVVRAAGRHGLGPGAYAVGIRSDTEREGTLYSAAFTLEGDPVPLVQPETVTETTREGSHVTVHVEPQHEETDRHDLTVRRRADPEREPQVLVDEQLYLPRFAGLRAAFSNLADGVETVTVRGDDSGHTRNLASGMAARFVAYDGRTYELQLGAPEQTATGGDYDLSGGWPSFGADARNAGHAATTAPSDPQEAWRFEAAGRIYDGPTVAGDLVFVASTDGNVYAVTAADGEEVWRFPVRGQARVTPAVADGTVYATGRNGGLYAIDARNGELEWQFPGNGEGFSISHPNVADGTVYVGDSAGTLFAVDAATGTDRWQLDVGGDVASSPAVGDGRVFVGWRAPVEGPEDAGEGGLTAVATDGTEEWSVSPGSVDGSATVADGTVYGGTGSGLLAWDAATGDERWTFERGGAGSPAVVGDTVYVGTHHGNLHAVDAAAGEHRWYFDMDKWADVAPAVADGTVAISSWDDHLYGVDASDGRERWSVELATPLSAPAIADGTVYVASDTSLVAVRNG